MTYDPQEMQRTLMIVGEALRDAAPELPDRVHYNLVDTTKMLSRTLIEAADRIGIAHASELAAEKQRGEEFDRIIAEAAKGVAPGVPMQLIPTPDLPAVPDFEAEIKADFSATQFEAGSIFSAPEGADSRDWGQAIVEAMQREYGGEFPVTLIEILAHALAQYGVAVAVSQRNTIAANIGAMGLASNSGPDPRLGEFVALRDHVATAVREGRI